jgi:MutS domain V
MLTQCLRRFAATEAEPPAYPFAPTDIARLHRLTTPDDGAAIDDHTWRDLLLDRYADSLSVEVGIVGRQELHRRLRAGASAQECATRRERIERLLREPERLDGLQRTLRPLRRADTEVAEVLFDPQWQAPPRPAWLAWAWLLPVGLAMSLAAALWTPWAWIPFGIVMYWLMTLQMRYTDRVGAWRRVAWALRMLLRAVALLDGSGQPLADDFAGRGARAGKIGRSLSRGLAAEAVPDVASYGDWFGLANVRHYFKTLYIVAAERDFLRECYRLCAALEADLALARHLRGMPSWCWAGRGGARALELDQGAHPLLEGGSPLSLALDGKGAFISGQNGVGKSTFLRMLGLNLVVARAFGFCYARRAVLPALPVVASMQNEDSLLDGHSLYIAELARARELLAAGERRPVICLVDEIFRGTNHEESVAAAAAVLDELAARSIVVVSSHNLVLGPLLAHRLAPWRIVRADGDGLRLEPGVLGQTNGVALLAQRGFGAGIQRKAERVAAWLARRRHGEVEPVLPAEDG